MIAFNGDVAVTGNVDGNVVALNGRVTLGPEPASAATWSPGTSP